MEESIESFIRFLAVERGLSENYQLSTQRSLTEFAQWCTAKHSRLRNPTACQEGQKSEVSGQPNRGITEWRAVTLPMISDYLADRKRSGLSAASIKLIVVALKIFFRF